MALRVESRPSKLSRAQWARYENVGLDPSMELERLVLNWATADYDVYGALTAITIESTIEGAPTVRLTLRDPDGRILAHATRRRPERPRRGGVDPVAIDEGWEPIRGPSRYGRVIDVTLDGVTFRLVSASYSSATGEAELTFEHRLVYWLRRKRGARRAGRKRTTRAQFVLALVREIKPLRYRFVCPELNARQPIGRASATRGLRAALGSPSASASRAGQTRDVPRVLDRIYPRHRIGATGATRLSERQVRAAAELAGLSPTEALHAAQIAHGESDFYPGVVQDDPGDGMVGHGLWQMTPNAWGGPSSATYQHMQSLGGLAAMRNPIQAARQMAWMFKQSGFQPWYGTKYLNLSARAAGSVLGQRIETDLTATDEGSAARGTYQKSYQFSRNADEDSWTAIQRLAQEVGWRAFVVGNTFYYMSEVALYGRRPRYQIGPQDPAVLDLKYTVDWGRPVSECSLSVVLDQWGAPPGAVVLIDGYGLPDGRWLVTSVQRDYFSPTAEVTLKQPGPAKKEPAPETATRATGADTSTSDGDAPAGGKGPQAVYARAKEIDAKNFPYVWGGGHGTRGQPSGGTGKDPGIGYDCSGYVGACLRAGGYGGSDPAVHSSSFGSLPGAKPGAGKYLTVHYNATHVYLVFEPAMGVSHKRADTSRMGEGGNAPRGPHLRSGPAYGAFSLCHFGESD